MIWFLAGVGVGLTVAMGLFAAMGYFDGKKSRAASALDDEPDEAAVMSRRRGSPAAEPMPRVPPTDVKRPPRPIAPLSPPPVRELTPASGESVKAVAAPTDLALEIARVQAAEAEQTIELPPAEPVRVVAEPIALPVVLEPEPELPAPEAKPEPAPQPEPQAKPAPAPEPESPAKAVDSALAQLTAPAEPPPAPKLPPLPKVTPARKFAPALPPRPPVDKT